jgi:hypothetical protein
VRVIGPLRRLLDLVAGGNRCRVVGVPPLDTHSGSQHRLFAESE